MRFKFWYSLLKIAQPIYDSSAGGNSNAIPPPPTQHLPFASLREITPCFRSQCKSGTAWKLLPTEFRRRCKQHVTDFQTKKNSKAKIESPQRTQKFAFGPICFKGTANRSQQPSIWTTFSDQNLKYWINSGFLIWKIWGQQGCLVFYSSSAELKLTIGKPYRNKQMLIGDFWISTDNHNI